MQCNISNFSDVELTVPKATVLGVAEEMSDSLVNGIHEVQTPAKSEPNKAPRRKKLGSISEVITG